MATAASGLPGAPTGPGSALPRCPPLLHGRHTAGAARGGPGKLNGEMTGWLGCGVHGTAKPSALPRVHAEHKSNQKGTLGPAAPL